MTQRHISEITDELYGNMIYFETYCSYNQHTFQKSNLMMVEYTYILDILNLSLMTSKP
jgi:hypothetical protein